MATNNNEETLDQFLKNRHLEKYFKKFKEQGAYSVADVLDGVDKDVLTRDIGMKPFEANRFLVMVNQCKNVKFTFLSSVLSILRPFKADMVYVHGVPKCRIRSEYLGI